MLLLEYCANFIYVSRTCFLICHQMSIGIAVGALSMLVPLYLSEIARKEIRGRLVSLEQWAETIGLVISFWIDYGKS
jgi:MFS family permease